MTLSQTAIITRNTILALFILLTVGIASFIGYRIWYSYYLANLPKVEEKPDTKFGLLPKPQFKLSSVSSSNFSYTLDTTTGGLPVFDKIVRVYFMPKTYASLLSAEKSQTFAQQFNIKVEPQILSETKYLFKEGPLSLTIDLETENFIYTNEATPSSSEIIQDDDEKTEMDFKNFLSSKNILKEPLAKGRFRSNSLKFDGTRFVPTPLRQEAEALEISLWPEDLDKNPILTNDFNRSLIYGHFVQSADRLENYLSLNYTFWTIDITTFATYPLKEAEAAFEDLKSGKGTVILEPLKPQVSITSIYLAYYQQESYTSYLQPIFVFEGPNFVAYVSAISDQYISQTN